VTASFVNLRHRHEQAVLTKQLRANHPWLAEKKRAGTAATGEKVRGTALKATGAELLAEVRAAAKKTRRTANAAIRETDCMKDARKYSEANSCVARPVFCKCALPTLSANDTGMRFQSAVNPLLLLASIDEAPAEQPPQPFTGAQSSSDRARMTPRMRARCCCC
jgi:hypothetical protein